MSKFKKPELQIHNNPDHYCMPEEVLVRQLQDSKLHLFEGFLHLPTPQGYKRDNDYPGWTSMFGTKRIPKILEHNFTLLTDGKRGWLVLVSVWSSQPDVDVHAMYESAFTELIGEAGIDVDYQIVTTGWECDADIRLSLRDCNKARIEQAFDEHFQSESGKIDGFLDIMPFGVDDEETIRNSWHKIDEAYPV